MTISNSHQQQIASFLDQLLDQSGMDLRYTISSGEAAQASASDVSHPQPHPHPHPRSIVEFSGPDTPLLTSRNGELLLAMEHIATQILRLNPEEHELISFDADSFKSARTLALQQSAAAAIETVRSSGLPFAFPPMTSRERRLLHLALAESGLPTASSGEAPRRFVVLYPMGHTPTDPTPTATSSAPSNHTPAATQDRTRNIRSAFRRR